MDPARGHGNRSCCSGKLTGWTSIGHSGTSALACGGTGSDAELTLADLAETSGISVSTLSRLESGNRRPSLEHLLALAHVYGVPIEELLGPEAAHDPRVTQRPTRRADRTVYPLTRRPGELQVFKTVIDGSTDRPEPVLKVHEGYEWLYVLSGRLRMVLEDHDLVLGAGRGRRVRHPDPPLVRAGRRAARSSSSASSASRASACTSGPAPPRASCGPAACT